MMLDKEFELKAQEHVLNITEKDEAKADRIVAELDKIQKPSQLGCISDVYDLLVGLWMLEVGSFYDLITAWKIVQLVENMDSATFQSKFKLST